MKEIRIEQKIVQPAQSGSTMKQTLQLVIAHFFDHDVGRNSAALAYYLLFAIFPLLIFISNLLGLLDLNVDAISRTMLQILPRDIVELLGTYLDYVSQTSSSSLFWFSLVFSVYFPMRAAKGLMDAVRLAYQLDKPKRQISYTLRQLVYTVVLLVVIALTLLFSAMGQRVLGFVVDLLPTVKDLPVSDFVITLWHYLRFVVLGILMFAALGVLYESAQDQRQPMMEILPGVAVALTAWLAVSIGFSFYVENFATYSIIYGTLGAVIVLLIWLYMTAVILILGAELNAALRTVHERAEEQEQISENTLV